jgi:hypothetical protein
LLGEPSPMHQDENVASSSGDCRDGHNGLPESSWCTEHADFAVEKRVESPLLSGVEGAGEGCVELYSVGSPVGNVYGNGQVEELLHSLAFAASGQS